MIHFLYGFCIPANELHTGNGVSHISGLLGSRYGRLMFVTLSLNCRVLPAMGWFPDFP